MKTLMALVLSLGMALLAATPVLAADSEPVAVDITSASALDEAALDEIVGAEHLMHAGIAEVLTDGVGGSSGGGAGPAVGYAVGRAAYAVGSRVVSTYRTVDKAIDKATGAVVKWVGRTAVAKKVWDWFHDSSDER